MATVADITQPWLSGQNQVDALLWQLIHWDYESPADPAIYYTFSTTEGRLDHPFGPRTVNPFTSAQEDAARLALANAAEITGIRFVQVADGTAADIHFANGDLLDGNTVGQAFAGYGYASDADSFLVSYDAVAYVFLDDTEYADLFTDPAPGTSGYQILLHELGHALGLKHPHEGDIRLSAAEDNTANTVMSYNWVNTQAEYQEYDIAALEWWYGSDGLGGLAYGGTRAEVLIGTAAAERLDGGGGSDTLNGGGGNDTLIGGTGHDVLDGGSGSDVLDGGSGDDLYYVSTGDVVSDSAGFDRVFSPVSWSLASGIEHLIFTGEATTSGTGNDLDNIIVGNSGSNWLRGRGGNDTIQGGAGNDTFNMRHGVTPTYGRDELYGGEGVDTVDFGATATSAVVISLQGGHASGGGDAGAGFALLSSVENANGSAFADLITGSSAANFLFGYNGNDTLDGGEGNDRLEGAAGNDLYVFSVAPGTTNADTVIGFVSGADRITLANVDLGPNGNFAPVDARFAAGAGFTAGRDASDRVIYNTTTGQLFYDSDGNGSAPAQLIATLQGAPALAATDIGVQDSTSPHTINGTSGNDSLTGGEGNDTINGNAGNDTLDGRPGDDRLDGGSGDDSVRGGAGNDAIFGGDGNDTLDGAITSWDDQDPSEPSSHADTIAGGLGDDVYYVQGNDVISDAGGLDHVYTDAAEYTLPAGFENLTFQSFSHFFDGEGYFIRFGGNELNNVIAAEGLWISSGTTLDGGDGNDTLSGSGGEAIFKFSLGSGNYGNDVLIGGDSSTIDFADARSAFVADLAAGTLTGGGSGGSGSATFDDIDNVIGGAFNDRIVANPSGFAHFDYAYIRAGGGNDTLEGVAGGSSYFFYGEEGNDRLVTRTGGDGMSGGAGADQFVFASAPGGPGTAPYALPAISDFVSGTDKIVLDASFMAALGASGNFASNDARFYAAAGASGGHDADDRVVYNTSTNELFYDPDGSGAAAAQIIATLQSGAALAATDIVVENGESSGGQTINGTTGNDSLVGGPGNDTLNGFGGNDTLVGSNDGSVADTLNGGPGDDTYFTSDVDVLTDTGGIDTVVTRTSHALQAGFENLILQANATDDPLFVIVGHGNPLGNLIRVEGDASAELDGGDGDDTLVGGGGDDTFDFFQGTGAVGNDVVDGGAGRDYLIAAGDSAVVVDFRSGTLTGSANGVAVAVSFMNIEEASGTPFNDRLVADDAGRSLSGFGGNDTLIGGSGNDTLLGGDGDDHIDGGNFGDRVNGGGGNDTLVAVGAEVTGAAGEDRFVLDSRGAFITDFATGVDKLRLDGNLFANVGPSGNFAAGDERFYAAPSGLAAHDATDRLLYNTTSGDLYYDADGNGSGAAQLIATLVGAPGLAATDVEVVNGSAPPPPPPPPGGQTITGTSGADTLTGGAGNDTISGLAGSDRLFGRDGNDSLLGGADADNLFGENGEDWFEGGTGQDRLNGGAGADSFVFKDPLGNTNFDYVNDFVSGTDKLLFDDAVFANLGGAFVVGDERFVAAPGARAGLEADDRVMYDTSTGKLYYDADGSGSGGQAIIAVLQGTPALTATDIVVI